MRRQIVVAAVLVVACYARNHGPIPEKIENVPEMQRQVLAIVPLGTTVGDASARMQAAGFVCTLYKQQPFNVRGEKLDYLFCDRSEGLVVQRRWQIALVLHHARVSEIRASTGLIGP